MEPSEGRTRGWRQHSFRLGVQEGLTVQSLKDGKSKPLGDLGDEPHRQSAKAPRQSTWGRLQEQQGGQGGWSRVREGRRVRGKAMEVTCRGDSPEMFCYCFYIQSPAPQTIPPTTTNPSQCFISTIRGEFSLLRRGGEELGSHRAFGSHLLCSWPAFVQSAPRKETAGGVLVLAVYMKLSPHLWCLFLFPKSQSRQYNLEIKEFVFVLLLGLQAQCNLFILFERKREKLPGMCLKSG